MKELQADKPTDDAAQPWSPAAIKELAAPSVQPRFLGSRGLRLLIMFLVFLSGGIVGIGGTVAFLRHRLDTARAYPEGFPNRLVARLRYQLDLTDEQVIQVDAILRRRHAALEKIRARTYPIIESELRDLKEDVAEVLTPEQQQRWKDFWERIEERRRSFLMLSGKAIHPHSQDEPNENE